MRKIRLKELVTIEQFLQGASEDLRAWLRERKPESLQQAAMLANNYVLARKSDGKAPPPKVAAPMQNRGGAHRPTSPATSATSKALF